MGTRVRTCVVLLALATAGLAGCQGAAKDNAGPTPGVVVTGTSTTGSPAASNPPPKTLPSGGSCVLIPMAKATELLGAPPKVTVANRGGSDEQIKFIDGCAYQAGAISLAYDINDYSNAGMDNKIIITQARTAMKAQSGVTEFAVPGGDDSIGFTVKVGPKYMARIEVVSGPLTIGVSSVGDSAARAKEVALAGTAELVAAVS